MQKVNKADYYAEKFEKYMSDMRVHGLTLKKSHKIIFQITSWLMVIKRILIQTLLLALIVLLPILAKFYR